MRISNWWEVKKNKFNDIKALVDHLQSRNRSALEADRKYVRMYSNKPLMGFKSFNYYKQDPLRESEEDRLRLNAIASVIDTLASKLSVEQPRVVTLLNNADFSVRSKSKKLQQFIDGILESSGSRVETIKAFRDALIVGTGVLKVFDEWGNIKCERILKQEILIDDEEAFYGCVSQMHHVRTISRSKLKEMFPEKAKQIDQATKVTGERINALDISDLVEVVESWHLPSSPEAKDGRHTITIENADLVDEQYNSSSFPFVFVHFKDPLFGFWGTGVVEELKPLQIEINRLLINVQKAMKAHSTPVTFIPAGSAISKMHISNELGAIVPFVGSPPIVRVNQAVHPEIFAQIENLYRKCFELIGVSMMSAAGQKPSGVNAAVAMRELQNIESERFSVVSRAYSTVFVELATKMIVLARDLYKENEADTKVFVKSKGFLDSINWADIDLEEDKFVLDLDTSNKLPLTRAGRISTITEWYQAGVITADKWREMMNVPDINNENELKDAPKDYIRQLIEQIITQGASAIIPPEPHDDLQFALEYSIMSYQKAKLEAYPDDRIEALSMYISMIEALLTQAQQQLQAQQAPAPPAQAQSAQAPMPQEAALLS